MYYGFYLDRDGKRVQYKKRGLPSKREAQHAELDFRDKINDIPSYITFEEVTNDTQSFTQRTERVIIQ